MPTAKRFQRNTDVPLAFLARVLRLPRTHPLLRYAWELERLNVRWDDVPIAGIYAILDTRDGDIYFGHTTNFYARKRRHHSQLQNQTHPNYFLRDACGGIDDRRWRFLVLEEVFEGRTRRLQRERWWHDHVPSCINVLNDKEAAECRALRGLVTRRAAMVAAAAAPARTCEAARGPRS